MGDPMWRTGLKVVSGFLTVACAIGGDPSSSKSAGGPEKACEDMADAVAKASARCSLGTYEQSFKSFVDTAALGDCKNIVQVRDHDALYDTCFPSLQTINCLDLSNANLDGSCRQQLLRAQ
jgi:hypothetical protein